MLTTSEVILSSISYAHVSLVDKSRFVALPVATHRVDALQYVQYACLLNKTNAYFLYFLLSMD